jgi:hypothetical protein
MLGMGCSAGIGPSVLSLPTDDSLSPNYAASLTSLNRWSSSRVTVYLDNIPAAEATAIERGMQLWNEALLGRIELVRVPTSDANIHLRTVSPTALRGATGIAEIQFNTGSGRLRSVRISLDQTLDTNYLAVTAMHELGHGLGVLDHSPVPEDLMYHAPSRRAGISERDRNTMLLLYREGRSHLLMEDSDLMERRIEGHKPQCRIEAHHCGTCMTRHLAQAALLRGLQKSENELTANPFALAVRVDSHLHQAPGAWRDMLRIQ